MKKIFILAIIAVLGLAATSCKPCETKECVQEEVVVDSTAVEAPVDSTLVAE